jgi:hypothetical protein
MLLDDAHLANALQGREVFEYLMRKHKEDGHRRRGLLSILHTQRAMNNRSDSAACLAQD